jgi:hypothetical protein
LDNHQRAAAQARIETELGRLNIASFGLLVGAVAQGILVAIQFTDPQPARLPALYLAPFVPPWLIVYFSTFVRGYPCGPRSFRRVLIFAMAWYATATLVVEVIYAVFHPVSPGPPLLYVRMVVYIAGGISFTKFIRFCMASTRQELGTANLPHSPSQG